MVEVHPTCRMVEVEGAGHSVMGDNLAGFRAAVEAFLAERTGGSVRAAPAPCAVDDVLNDLKPSGQACWSQ
jgi:hypothetical protein